MIKSDLITEEADSSTKMDFKGNFIDVVLPALDSQHILWAFQSQLLTQFCHLKVVSHIASEYQTLIYYISPLCVLKAPTI